jgi:hypothetical protein
VTRASLREYAAGQRERYLQGTRAEKRQLLDEVVAVTGIHRKAAIRLLRRAPRPRAMPGPGYGELTVAPDVEKRLRQASRPTLTRLLAPARAQYPRRGATSTRPGTWLRQQIPIRTFTEWNDARPGFCEVDLVAHGGSSTEGFSLCPLCAVDIATTWVELEAVWGKGPRRVGGAIHHVWQRLPVPLVGLDSDSSCASTRSPAST